MSNDKQFTHAKRKTTWGWYALGYFALSLFLSFFKGDKVDSATPAGLGYTIGSLFAPTALALLLSAIAFHVRYKKVGRTYGSVFLWTYLIIVIFLAGSSFFR